MFSENCCFLTQPMDFLHLFDVSQTRQNLVKLFNILDCEREIAGDDLIFVKSNLTDRWWMELAGENDKSEYIACSHEDYLKANRNEVPDRWVNAMERLK